MLGFIEPYDPHTEDRRHDVAMAGDNRRGCAPASFSPHPAAGIATVRRFSLADGNEMHDLHGDDGQRYRPPSRSAFSGAMATFGLAGIFVLLGNTSMAVGMAVLAGAMLVWAAVYVMLYRV